MTDIKSMLINVSMLGLLFFSIMSFILIVQVDGEIIGENRITNNSLINDSFGDLANALDNQNVAEKALNSLEDVPPEEYVGDLNVASTVSLTRTMKSIIIGVWNVYVEIPIVILGVDPIVSSVIATILLALIAIGIWALWKGAISS